jgi:hypothetical protein
MESIMILKVALSASIVTLLLVSPVAAHHPGGAGNTSGAGPIVTIPATTLEQGHFGVVGTSSRASVDWTMRS